MLVCLMVKNPPAMQETQVCSLGREDPLEKELATHSSILAWRIPCAEEPGCLQSVRSKKEPYTTKRLTLAFAWGEWFSKVPQLRKCLICALFSSPPQSVPHLDSGGQEMWWKLENSNLWRKPVLHALWK